MDKQNYLIPGAIIIAGFLIATAVLFVGKNDNVVQQKPQPSVQDNAPARNLDAVLPIDEQDHVLGNPNAKVKIVEYSDFECPFCKRFHNTMNRIMDEYADTGDVAWVFRHFPLEGLHPVKARKEAKASECAASIGGEDAFWQFTNRLFELTASNNRTDINTVIPQIVKELNIDENAFNTCMESEEYEAKINRDVANATETGGRGTPWSILIAPDGTKYEIGGAQPYETVKQLIEVARKK